MQNGKKTLLLIDSFALIFRAYYAFPPTLQSASGEPTNAVYGFTSLLLDVLNKFKPEHVVAIFDSAGPTIRESEHSFYKANRDEADELFLAQIPRVRDVLDILKIPVLNVEGYEADDVIATIDNIHSGEWAQTIIVTGDQDLFQLVDEDTFVYLAGRRFSESKLFDAKSVFDKLGVNPNQITDYKGLKGDPSDNIPGVKGIGEKTAVDLLQRFGSVDGVYKNIDEVKGAIKEKLLAGYEDAINSRTLATVVKEVPISFDFDLSHFGKYSQTEVDRLFSELNFRSLNNRIKDLSRYYKKEEEVPDLGLFSSSESLLTKEKRSYSYTKLDEIKEAEIKNKVILHVEFSNLEKNPTEWTIVNGIIYFPEKVSYVRFLPQDIGRVLEVLKVSGFVIFGIKEFYHSLINLGFDLKDTDWDDIGFLSWVISGGAVAYNLKNALYGLGCTFGEEVEGNLLEIQKAYGKAMDSLSGNNLQAVYHLERSISSTIIEMEQKGIMFDASLMQKYAVIVEEKINILRNDIYKNAGHEFNLNSPKQLSEVLFIEKSLPSVKKTRGGVGSTNEIVLKQLSGLDPIVDNMLEFREIDKLRSTYISALPSYVSADGRIHAIFDQLGAISGRFSSRNPNMQNIPKEEVAGINLRSTFVAPEGRVFVAFDYSQQELRILSALSKEQVMIDGFNEDLDVHKITAAELFGVDFDDVTPAQRKVGKTVNFSVIYGISAFGLAERLSIGRAEAAKFIDTFFARYKSIDGYYKRVLDDARQNGYVSTVIGRRRYSNTINSNNKMMRATAERELFNFVIQGTAADIMKMAISRFEQIAKKYNANLLLQIHDEFLFEVEEHAESKMDQFKSEISEVLLNAFDIGVKYNVDVRMGRRWGEMS